VPSGVLGQLGNRVQHALRTFTPEDATALRKTVSTFPKSTDYDIAEMLTSLGIGEAAVTVLSERGVPTPVAWTMLRSPRSLMGPVDPAELQQAVAGSPLTAKYGQAVDRESAYERLAARLAPPPAAPEAPAKEPAPRRRGRGPEPEAASGGVVAEVLGSAAFRSFARSAASSLGREITRGLFGTRKHRR
jgi:DNA helicase HerA-like ATPase